MPELKNGIVAINNLIRDYQGQWRRQMEFLDSDTFRNSVVEPVDESVRFVKKHTDQIFTDLIYELYQIKELAERESNRRKHVKYNRRRGNNRWQ
jgi:hypothetical protein